MSLPPIISNCECCGKSYRKWPYEKTRTCCSQKCGNFLRRTLKKVTCKYCDKEFEKSIAEIKRSKNNFCSPRCYKLHSVGVNAPRYKGGNLCKEGYKVIYVNKKKIFEHRAVVEENIGRRLLSSEHVHHINENKLDNRLCNLQVLTPSEHGKLHKLKDWCMKNGFCIKCKCSPKNNGRNGVCKTCYDKVTMKNDSPP